MSELLYLVNKTISPVRIEEVSNTLNYVKLENQVSIKWEVEIQKEGRYELTFGYRSHSGDKAQKLMINHQEWGIGFPYTYGHWSEIKWTSSLKSGKNFIEIKSVDGLIDLAYMKVGFFPYSDPIELYELPTVHPIKNIFYKNQSNDIQFILNCRGLELISITSQKQKVQYTFEDYPYVEDSRLVKISKESLNDFTVGNHCLQLMFNDQTCINIDIDIKVTPIDAPLKIIALDVKHGYSTCFILPNGEVALLDSGDHLQAENTVMKFLDCHGISKLDYYIITHYHDDQCGKKEEIIKKYQVKRFLDYRDFKSGDAYFLGGLNIKIFNSYYDDLYDENSRSLSFRLEYNGFVYIHGGDIYGKDQQRILKKYPNDIFAHVYNANHHFHGSIDINYLRRTNPYLFLVSAEKAVYARGAYAHLFKNFVASYLKANNGRLIEDLLTLEVGSTVIRVKDASTWSYECNRDINNTIVPNIIK